MAVDAEPEHSRGDVFLDARGSGRAMRLSWHPEADIVVLSLWREETCAGTFRMPQADVGAFIDSLIDGLRDAPGVHLPPRHASSASSPSAGTTPLPGTVPETQHIPVQPARPAFAEWAFRSDELDGRANAS